MYSPILHGLIKWLTAVIDWLIQVIDFVFSLLVKWFPITICVIGVIVLAVTGGGGLLPGCGGPPLPTPPATVPATATVPPSATPEPTPEPTPGPTPTMPESPASPLQTPGAGW